MILADILQWFLLIVGALLTFNAHWLFAHALFPAVVARSRERYERQPVRVTLVGLAIVVPSLTVSIALSKAVPHAVVQSLSVGFMLVLGLLALIGSAGLVERIGLGLSSQVDAQQPWRRVMRGGIVLALAFLMPFLGWFVLLPWTLISGLGAWALAGRAARSPRASHGVAVPSEDVASSVSPS